MAPRKTTLPSRPKGGQQASQKVKKQNRAGKRKENFEAALQQAREEGAREGARKALAKLRGEHPNMLPEDTEMAGQQSREPKQWTVGQQLRREEMLKQLADLKAQREADMKAEIEALLRLEQANLLVAERRAASAATRKAITQVNEQLRAQYSEL